MHSLCPTKKEQIESEYKLIDPERLKQDLRASRASPNHHLTQNSSKTSIHPTFAQPENIDNGVELPVSHSLKCSEYKKQSRSQQIDKGFLAQNLKEIEDVMYGEVFRHKNAIRGNNQQLTTFSPKSEQKGSKLGGSRFNKSEGPIVFSSEYSKQKEQLVANYNKLKIQRHKYAEAGYFKNKQRSVEQIELNELFEKYNSSQQAMTNQQGCAEIKTEEVKNAVEQVQKQQNLMKEQQVREYQKNRSYAYIDSSNKQIQDTMDKLRDIKEGISPAIDKQCATCKISESNPKLHTKTTSNKLINQNPTDFQTQEHWQINTNPIYTEQRVSRINASPDKSKMRYLSSQDKRYFNRKSSVQPDQSLLEAGKLKKQYLRHLEDKSHQKQKQQLKNTQILTLNHDLIASAQKQSLSAVTAKHRTPRKKIFSGIQVMSSRTHIKIIDEQSSNYQTHTPKITHNGYISPLNLQTPHTYKKIFSSRKQKEGKQGLLFSKNKTITYQLDFNHHRQELVSSRVKFFKSKDKKEKSASPRKKSLIPGLRLLEMSAQVRKWYEDNRKDIIFQAQRICSYDLINRYMSQQEISSRLFNMVTGMIDPRRWVLLMVDQVYARLKDRYLPG